MTSKMTKRDKLLIYIMIIVLVVCGFIWILILPQMNLSSELGVAINELQAVKLPMETAVMGLDGMKGVVKTADENLDAAMKDFYPQMENYEIDKIFTGIMVDKYGLNVSSLTMSPVPTGVLVPPYGMATVDNSAAESSESETSIASDNISILTSNISVVATATKDKLQKFIDDLFTDYPSIRITSYEILDEGASRLNLSCDFYMQAK